MQRDLEHAEAEDRALEADRRERDPDLLEQLLLRQLGDLVAVRPLTMSVSIEVAACEIAQPRPSKPISSIVSPSAANFTDIVTSSPQSGFWPFALRVGVARAAP